MLIMPTSVNYFYLKYLFQYLAVAEVMAVLSAAREFRKPELFADSGDSLIIPRLPSDVWARHSHGPVIITGLAFIFIIDSLSPGP